MAKGISKGADNQLEKSARTKIIAADQTSADDVDLWAKAPSRVHIFIGKPSPRASSKSNSDDEQWQWSSFKRKRPIASP